MVIETNTQELQMVTSHCKNPHIQGWGINVGNLLFTKALYSH